MDEKINARGLSCPQPAILTRTALEQAGGGEVIVLVDTMTQVQNCRRAAEKLGWQTSYEEKGDVYELRFSKRA